MVWPHRRRRSQLDLSRRRRDLSRLKRVATLNAEPHQSIPTRRNLPQAAKVPGLRRAHRRQERHCYAHEMTRNHEARFTRHIHPAMIESGDFLVVVLIAFCVCTLLCSIRYITQSRSTRRILPYNEQCSSSLSLLAGRYSIFGYASLVPCVGLKHAFVFL